MGLRKRRGTNFNVRICRRSTTFLPTPKPQNNTILTISQNTTHIGKNQILSEKGTIEELDEHDKKTPENCRLIPVLCKNNIPNNVSSTKLTDVCTDKNNNTNRKADNSLIKLQRNTSRHSNIIHKRRNDSPHIFGCILHIRNGGTKHRRWIFFPRTKTKHTDTSNAPRKRNSACRMWYNQ